MINLEDIFLKIGFQELPGFMGERVFGYKTQRIFIKVSHLPVIPSMGFGPGFSIQFEYRDRRKVQGDLIYIPDKANSFEAGLAFIVHGIGYGNKDCFPGLENWYTLGESYKEYLPWEIERKKQREAYEKLPKAFIEISWLRVLVKLLKEWRDELKLNKEVGFTFDGEFVKFKCDELTIPIPAKGKKWDAVYYLDFKELENIPIKIFKHRCSFIVEDGKLIFGNKQLMITPVITPDYSKEHT